MSCDVLAISIPFYLLNGNSNILVLSGNNNILNGNSNILNGNSNKLNGNIILTIILFFRKIYLHDSYILQLKTTY